MIDPKQFVSSNKEHQQLKPIDASIFCSEPNCYERVTNALYDSKEKKAYWTCPNGHEGSARIPYE